MIRDTRGACKAGRYVHSERQKKYETEADI